MRDKSGEGFWPEGFWSGFALAAERSAKRRETEERRARYGHPYVVCSDCGKKTHPDRIIHANLLPVCPNCAGNTGNYTESANF